mmetsp:Transcript_4999/g.12677  ORF Transcript_4999/g.12677 Transcript_4999/m.12677 type:complete len:100 (+) Transcript_4999:808-1107(+)
MVPVIGSQGGRVFVGTSIPTVDGEKFLQQQIDRLLLSYHTGNVVEQFDTIQTCIAGRSHSGKQRRHDDDKHNNNNNKTGDDDQATVLHRIWVVEGTMDT